MSAVDEFFQAFPLKLAVVAAVLTTTTTLSVGVPPLVVVVRCVMAFLAFLILGMLLIGLWDLISNTGYEQTDGFSFPESATTPESSSASAEPKAVTGKPSSASLPPPSDFDIARAASAAQAILNAAAAATPA